MVTTLLTCGNELVSCGNDFLTCGNDFLTCGNDLLSFDNIDRYGLFDCFRQTDIEISYLHSRKQKIRIDGHFSDALQVTLRSMTGLITRYSFWNSCTLPMRELYSNSLSHICMPTTHKYTLRLGLYLLKGYSSEDHQTYTNILMPARWWVGNAQI